MPTITFEDTTLRYRVTGQGPEKDTGAPPLVLIHGAAGGLYVWLDQLNHDFGRRVIALDLPGHGQSKPEPKQVDLADYARHVVGLADALGVDRFIPVGHSMGGTVALTLALDHAPRVAALVLMATGAKLPTSDFIFAAIRSDLGEFGTLLAGAAYSPHTPRAVIERYTTGPIQASVFTALGDFQACNHFDVRARLPEITAPTLILAGEDDQLVGAGRTKQLEASIPNSRLVTVAQAGHMLMHERPDETNAALASFLTELTE